MSDTKPMFYSNASATGVSPYDLTLTFQRRGLPPRVSDLPLGASNSVVLEEMDIAMSHSHAKILAAGLLMAILDFEKDHHRIPLSADDQRKYDSVMARLALSK